MLVQIGNWFLHNTYNYVRMYLQWLQCYSNLYTYKDKDKQSLCKQVI